MNNNHKARQVLAPKQRHRGGKVRMKVAPHPFFVALAARREAIAREQALQALEAESKGGRR